MCSDLRPDGPYLCWVSAGVTRQYPPPSARTLRYPIFYGGGTDSQGTPPGDPSLDLTSSDSVPRVSVNPVQPPTGHTLPWKSATPGRQRGPPHGHRSRQTRPATSPHAHAGRSGQERESRAGFQAEVICHVTFLDMRHTGAHRFSLRHKSDTSFQTGRTRASLPHRLTKQNARNASHRVGTVLPEQ